jgi:hypothetical protein
MKLFSALYDRESQKYAVFYSVVLILISGILLLFIFNLVKFSPVEPLALFFEGFVSLYMLCRHKKTKAALGGILKYIAN